LKKKHFIKSTAQNKLINKYCRSRSAARRQKVGGGAVARRCVRRKLWACLRDHVTAASSANVSSQTIMSSMAENITSCGRNKLLLRSAVVNMIDVEAKFGVADGCRLAVANKEY
jgi:hypothetical protein